MANTDWAQPTPATLYTKVLTDLKDLSALASTLMRVDNPTSGQDPDAGAIEGSIKWSVANNKFQKNIAATGSAPSWEDLTTTYNINSAMLGGRTLLEVTDIANLSGGTLPNSKFDINSHGDLSSGDKLHAAATTSIAGFMTAADKGKLDNLVNITDAEVAIAYDSQRAVISSGDLNDPTTRRVTGAAIANFIEEKLKTAITAVTFKQLYNSGTTLIDVKRGQYQELIVTSPTSITFKDYPNNPFTMYLYITSNGHLISVPTGTNHRWSGGSQPANIESTSGIDLLTINYDGKGNFFYMLLADMR